MNNRNLIHRTVITCITVLLSCASWSQHSLTVEQWQEDLRFLQSTVHKDYTTLFRKITADQFDAEVAKFHSEIPVLASHEIVAGFSRIVSLFGYGHTDVDFTAGPVTFHSVPLNLYWFSDGVFIEGAHRDHANVVGAKVLKVEGVGINDALDAIRPFAPVENEQYFRAYCINMLLMPELLHAARITTSLKESITMTVVKDNVVSEVRLEAPEYKRVPKKYGFVKPGDDWVSSRDQSETPYYLAELDKIYYDALLPEDKTLYVRQSQIQDDPSESIPDFYARVFGFIEANDVEKLILDVRLNGGGNNYKNKPVITGIINCDKINQPGKLFVILGRRTFSACQNLVNELDNYTNAIFVGEPTAENINFLGDNREIKLPNSNISVFLSFAWWQDKPQWENADWLAPDVAVEMSFEDYRSNKDPVLETALTMSAEGLITDPIGHLRELFVANKFDELKADARRIVDDPRYKFVDLESDLNNTGYHLLRGGQTEAALFAFELNTELFPESANTWDSLGEAMLESGQKDKAIEYYNKAILLDPDGGVGDNARAMLRRIRSQE